jgi:hypothetical protein
MKKYENVLSGEIDLCLATKKHSVKYVFASSRSWQIGLVPTAKKLLSAKTHLSQWLQKNSRQKTSLPTAEKHSVKYLLE